MRVMPGIIGKNLRFSKKSARNSKRNEKPQWVDRPRSGSESYNEEKRAVMISSAARLFHFASHAVPALFKAFLISSVPD
jgi:hypothetical protein